MPDHPRQLRLPFANRTGALARTSENERSTHKSCVFCRGFATTHDHIPPRGLLKKPYPQNLFTVPSCHRCNNAYSVDEEYVQIVLAQIGVTPNLSEKIEEGGTIDRALRRSPALEKRIFQGLSVAEDGRVMFAPDINRIANVASKVACGLHWHRYGKAYGIDKFRTLEILGPGDEPSSSLISSTHFWPGFRSKKWNVLQNGVFSYLFAKGWMAGDPPLYCVMNFSDTITCAVGCPPKSGFRRRHRHPRSRHAS